MSVIGLKPHRISFLIPGKGYEDDNGDWHEGSETWSELIECHATANGASNVLTYEDGTTGKYTYTIGRLPSHIREILRGERVRLNILGIEKEYTVKGFQRYQLQSKIWV